MDAHRHSTCISEPALLSNARVKKRVSSLLRSDAFFLACPFRLEAVTKILTLVRARGHGGAQNGEKTQDPPPQTGGRNEAKRSPEDHRREEVHEATGGEKTEPKNKTTANGLARPSV